MTEKGSHNRFTARDYLQKYYTNPAGHHYLSLRCYHDAFQSLPSGLRILDYGTGPSILTTVSAAPKASVIILSDFADDNKKAVWQWLEKDPSAFDWSPYFSRVVQGLEGKSEKEAVERQELVRRAVKAVVHCDITQDPPIEKGYDQEYDVVMSSLCLEVASQTLEEYKQGMCKLAALVKPGGSLIIYSMEEYCGPEFYIIGDLRFKILNVSLDVAVEAMRDAGVTDISVQKIRDAPQTVEGSYVMSFMFLQGTKCSW